MVKDQKNNQHRFKQFSPVFTDILFRMQSVISEVGFGLFCLHFFLLLDKKKSFMNLSFLLGLATENTKLSIDKKP